jgi:hypothetical protein
MAVKVTVGVPLELSAWLLASKSRLAAFIEGVVVVVVGVVVVAVAPLPHPLRQQNRAEQISSSSIVRENFALVDFIILFSLFLMDR